MLKRILAIICLFWALAAAGAPRVSLLTALPGAEVYALEGHSALRIVEPETGRDYVVNWGVYDFNAPNFVYRFVAGQTDYLCAPQSTEAFVIGYMMEGRQVVEQVLALDSVQAAGLIGLVENNLKPENSVYRYNYVKDNCATRPLAMIEAALGRKLLSDEPSGTSFREEMRRFHKDYPWYQFGIDLALGRGIDKEISVRETAFSPVTLMELLKKTGVVTATKTYGEQTLRHEPTPWYKTPMTMSAVVLIMAIGVCFMRRTEWFDSLLFGAFFVLGCIITFLIVVSTHEATSPNLLILWLNPLCVLGAVLPWIKKAKKAEMSYFFVNFALLILLIVLVLLTGRGMNPAFWPLIAADAVRSVANIQRCKKTANRL